MLAPKPMLFLLHYLSPVWRVCEQSWTWPSKKHFLSKPKITSPFLCHPRTSLWMSSIEMHCNSVTLREICGSVCLCTKCPQPAVHLSVLFLLTLPTAVCTSKQLPVLSVSLCTAAVSRPKDASALPVSSWELSVAQRPFLWFPYSWQYSEWLESPNTQFQHHRGTNQTVYYRNF